MLSWDEVVRGAVWARWRDYPSVCARAFHLLRGDRSLEAAWRLGGLGPGAAWTLPGLVAALGECLEAEEAARARGRETPSDRQFLDVILGRVGPSGGLG